MHPHPSGFSEDQSPFRLAPANIEDDLVPPP